MFILNGGGSVLKKASIRENYIYNMIYQVLNIILPLITTPYISRVLGPDGIGVYSYTYSIVSTFVMVGSLGIGTYGQKEIAAVSDDCNQISVKFYEIQTVKIMAVTIASILFCMMSLFYKQYTIFFVIQVPYFLGAVLDISWLYQGLENFRMVAVRNILIKVLSLLLIFALVKNESHLIIYMVILSLAQVFGNLTMWVSLNKILVKIDIKQLSLKRHIKPTFVYFVPTVSYQIYAVLDKAMLGYIYNDTAENGFYEQAHKLINMMTMVVSSYTIVMRSRMTVYFAKQEDSNIRKHLNDSMHFIGLLVFPMSFGLAAVASNIVPWFFGVGYEKVIILLHIFSPYFVFMGVCTCLGTHILTPSGQQGKSNVGQCISAIANVCLNMVLIPRLGAIGAAIASVISEIIIVVAYMHYVSLYMTYKTLFGILYKYFIAALIMFIPAMFLSMELSPDLMSTALIVMVGGVVYLAMLIILKDRYMLEKIKGIKGMVVGKLSQKH